MSEQIISIKQADDARLQKLYKESACTMLGYMPEELHLYIEQLQDNGFLEDDYTIYTIKGSVLNSAFLLVDDPFPEDLNIFIIPLDCMKNIEQFATTLRFTMGYRWLDDIINNSIKGTDESDQ